MSAALTVIDERSEEPESNSPLYNLAGFLDVLIQIDLTNQGKVENNTK